jgi:adenylylsulfate kinase
MSKVILIMGLPGSGKTTLAQQITYDLESRTRTFEWFNADIVRKQHNDWDFSVEGRLRQARRMRDLASESVAEFVLVDFVAPLCEMRTILNADFTVWVNTIDKGRFEDTNAMFEQPLAGLVDFIIKEQDAVNIAPQIIKTILGENDEL